MKRNKLKALARWIGALAFVILVNAGALGPQSQPPVAQADPALKHLVYMPFVARHYYPDCRFGITVPFGIAGFDIANLGVGSYLNWDMSASPARPGGIAYIQEVRVGDAGYAAALAGIPAVARAQRGAYWLVGNEPDTTYGLVNGGEQDNAPPDVYAQRYHDIYTQIKSADPTAQVGIGGIVQPTAVRMEYLDRMLAAYRSAYGSLPPSDFWHIHAFILNEVPGQPDRPEWGTGLPVDQATRPYASSPEAIAPDQNDDLSIFDRRLTAFRQWMSRNGQRNKPLWITEYGVLMPSDPSLNNFTISMDRTRNFMLQSFTYFKTRTDAASGLASDGNRLVQRWYWWALSSDLRKVGGGLYDESQTVKPKSILYDAFASASCR